MPRWLILAAGLAIGAASFSCHAVQRAFVASSGTDANTASDCSRDLPCRSFAAALTVVDAGGEILALDAAGYGMVTVTKSVSIIGSPGFYAGIGGQAAGGAVTVDTAGIDVVLRGLSINFLGSDQGIYVAAANSVTVEDCIISGFTGGSGILLTGTVKARVVDTILRGNAWGIRLLAGASADVARTRMTGNFFTGVEMLGNVADTATSLTVSDSVVSGGEHGITAFSSASNASVRVSITRSTITNHNGVGIWSEANGGSAVVSVSRSLITRNLTGLYQNGTGVLESHGNNTVRRNRGNDTAGTITPVPPL